MMFKPNHSYNIDLKKTNNWNCITVNKNVVKFNNFNLEVDLCGKFNIDITKFKKKFILINYLYSLDLNNVNN